MATPGIPVFGIPQARNDRGRLCDNGDLMNGDLKPASVFRELWQGESRRLSGIRGLYRVFQHPRCRRKQPVCQFPKIVIQGRSFVHAGE